MIKCRCGRDCISAEVRRPGPNQGRWFWKCATGSCNYFKWDNSAHSLTRHPTAAYSAAAQASAHISAKRNYLCPPSKTYQSLPPDKDQPETPSYKFHFAFHDDRHLRLRIEPNHVHLFGILREVPGMVYVEAEKQWLFPIHLDAYNRALSRMYSYRNTYLIKPTRLEPPLMQTMKENKDLETEFDVRSTEVEDQLMKVRDAGLWDKLKPFQQDAVRKAIRFKGRILFADEPGLGKSVQALATIQAYEDVWPVLVLCAPGDEERWSKTIQEWLHLRPSNIHISTSGRDIVDRPQKRKKPGRESVSTLSRTKKRLNNGLPVIPVHIRAVGSALFGDNSSSDDSSDEDDDEASEHMFFIVNYKVAEAHSKQIKERRFRCVIADNSEHLLMRQAKSTRMLLPVLQEAFHTVMLSTKLTLERPVDMYTHLFALRKDMFSDFGRFGSHFCDGKQNVFGWEYNGKSHTVELKYILDHTIWSKHTLAEVADQTPWLDVENHAVHSNNRK